MAVLTLYSMYIERGTFMVALEKPEAGLVSNFFYLVSFLKMKYSTFMITGCR